MSLCEKTKTISIVWSIEDVIEMNPDLTTEEAWLILKSLERHHDATMGITWETIAAAAEQVGEVYR